MSDIVFYGFASAVGASFLLTLVFLFCVIIFREKINHSPSAVEITRYPKISLLKPFKGVDDSIEENLESYYKLDYPDYEIIIGVETLSDPCVYFIEKVKRRYPNIKTVIIATGLHQMLNPKVDSLTKLAQRATGEIYWLNDANTRVKPDMLKRLVSEYERNNSKIVFSPIKGTGGNSIGSIMENAYINLFLSGGVISAWKLFHKTVIVGKSMFMEKASLDKLGGYKIFGKYLAEDYVMGQIYRENKMPVSTNCVWVTNYNSSTSVKDFTGRVYRWCAMRFRLERFFYLGEILTNPVGIAIIALPFLGTYGLFLLGITVILKIIIEYVCLFTINKEDSRNIKILLLYPVLMLYKDILLLTIYPIPFLKRTVKWKGRKIFIGKGSLISAIDFDKNYA
ncbi:ceramide glucosyltransferase [Elusimicrobiota bacterium]